MAPYLFLMAVKTNGSGVRPRQVTTQALPLRLIFSGEYYVITSLPQLSV